MLCRYRSSVMLLQKAIPNCRFNGDGGVYSKGGWKVNSGEGGGGAQVIFVCRSFVMLTWRWQRLHVHELDVIGQP